jgi:hypothetical protein
MTPTFSPRLEILPAAQRRLWPELAETPADFTLYGGTAIALRLAHRQSVDFDFFTLASFEPNALLSTIPYLRDAVARQASSNTLSATVDRSGLVQLSYFGGLGIGQVAPEEIVEGPGFSPDFSHYSSASGLRISESRCATATFVDSRRRPRCPQSVEQNRSILEPSKAALWKLPLMPDW